ncbi:MAG TPA: hypothetical protein VFS98_03965, partial [Methylomirabilota bacterium]|nr:hypothetical protein [Methylomirabilota bacterium]
MEESPRRAEESDLVEVEIGEIGGEGICQRPRDLKLKAAYEDAHGHDFLARKTERKFVSEEFRRMLLDPLTFRRRRMVDVGFHGGKVYLNLRVRDGSISPAAELAWGN